MLSLSLSPAAVIVQQQPTFVLNYVYDINSWQLVTQGLIELFKCARWTGL